MTKQIIERVRALMMDEGLDTEDDLLVLKISIIYLNAQRDYVQEEMGK